MKELILIVMMFVFGDMQEEANNMTQYVPYDKMSHCLKDARAIKSGRPTLNTAISEESKGKRASCGLKIVELVDGKMITMYNTPDDVPAGTSSGVLYIVIILPSTNSTIFNPQLALFPLLSSEIAVLRVGRPLLIALASFKQ